MEGSKLSLYTRGISMLVKYIHQKIAKRGIEQFFETVYQRHSKQFFETEQERFIAEYNQIHRFVQQGTLPTSSEDNYINWRIKYSPIKTSALIKECIQH